MTKLINIFGGPGIGKSTVIAGLYHYMKLKHINVEIAHEVAKDYVWEEQLGILHNDQLLVFAQQHRRIYRLMNKVDYIIVDCPLLMCIPYIAEGFLRGLEPLIVESHHTFDSQSFVLNRTDAEYNPEGRYHNEIESIEKHREIVDVLHKYDIPYSEIDVGPEAPKKIMSLLYPYL